MEVDIKIIKDTQKSLGKYVKRPQLTDKLLQKPPFRFLHDIIKAIIKDTGFLAGLYTADELDYEKIKDKESKIAFLTKLINVVKILAQKELSARPSKIIAGLEAAKTNELLQAIAYCVDKKIDSKDAVQTVKEEASKNPKVKEKVVNKPKTTKNNETKEKVKEKVTSKKPEEKQKKGVKPEVKDKKKLEIKSKSVQKEKSIENPPDPELISEPKNSFDEKESITEINNKNSDDSLPVNVEKEETPKIIQENQTDMQPVPVPPQNESPIKRRKSIITDEVKTENEKPENTVNNNEELSIPPISDTAVDKQENLTQGEAEKESLPLNEVKQEITSVDPEQKKDSGRQSRLSGRRQSIADTSTADAAQKREPSAPKSKFIRSQTEDKIVRLRPQSVRPPSARPGAPKRRDKNIEIILQPDEPVKPPPDVIAKMDTLDAELDDNVDNLVIIEDPTLMDDNFSLEKGKNDGLFDGSGDKEGHLVQQILETQREFSNAGAGDAGLNQTETTWESAFDSRHLNSAKNEALRESIQKLTKSVNPLGKLLDFMQEDVDSMQIELTQQLELYQNALVDVENEKIATDAAIQPFKQQLHQLQENIKFYQTSVMDVRANILNNEQKILKKLNEF